MMAKGTMDRLKGVFVASSPVRSFFVREVPVSASSSLITTMSRPEAKMDDVTGRLMWLLRTLWEDDQALFFLRLPTVVDELDRLIKSEPRCKELVSPYTAGLIGDLSIVGECLRQLETYQPWANGFENAMVDHGDPIKREFSERTQSEAKVVSALHETNIAMIQPFGDPSDKKFEYPVGKRRNRTTVAQLRDAEQHLDTFWAKADELMLAKAGTQDDTAYQKLLLQPRPLQRTPEWVEPAVTTKEKKADATNDELSQSLSAVHLDHEPPVSIKREILAAAASATKSKAKTRGTPAAASLDDNDENHNNNNAGVAHQPAPEDNQPLFQVDARALKVFRIVFFDPSVNTTPGEVAWTDFLHALQATGFVAQKLYGSVWHFQPTKLDVERSIQFHEPHPRAKIPFLVARRHGRRLTRAYGWHGGLFELARR